MAECYTNVQCALQALMRSGHTVASMPAFIAGAAGPTPLYMYYKWKKKRKPDLPLLAEKMHHEKTGAFLFALIQQAATPTQQSYVMGYIAAYSTSCTLNPYINAISAEGMPYSMPNGEYTLAAVLDSELYHRDYNTRSVPVTAVASVLIGEELAQVAALLRGCIEEVYGQSIPLLALADVFHHNYLVRRLMCGQGFMPKARLRRMQRGARTLYGGPLLCRMQPAPKLHSLPQNWENPYTGEKMNLTLNEVLTLTQQTSAVCVTAVVRYWLGQLLEEKLLKVLGNNDFITGIPCETSVGNN